MLRLPEDDAKAVERMLMFCYTDDYDDSSSGANQANQQSLTHAMSRTQSEAGPTSLLAVKDENQTGRGGDTAPADDKPLVGSDSQENAADNSTWKRLINNVSVYAIADKYAIDPLKALAKGKFKALFETDFSPHGLSHVVREVFSSTPATDRGLRDVVVDKFMVHLEVLLQEEAFGALLQEQAELGWDLLHRERKERKELSKHVANVVGSYERRIDVQNRELELTQSREIQARDERNRLQLMMDNRENVLRKTSVCRQCDADFFCVFLPRRVTLEMLRVCHETLSLINCYSHNLRDE